MKTPEPYSPRCAMRAKQYPLPYEDEKEIFRAALLPQQDDDRTPTHAPGAEHQAIRGCCCERKHNCSQVMTYQEIVLASLVWAKIQPDVLGGFFFLSIDEKNPHAVDLRAVLF